MIDPVRKHSRQKESPADSATSGSINGVDPSERPAGTSSSTWLVRLLAGLAALGLLYFPGLGMVDLVSAAISLADRDELVSMRAAYGLVVGFLLPAMLFLLAARPSVAAATVQLVLVAAVAFFTVAAVSGLWTAMVGGGGLLVLGAALYRLAPKELGVRPAAPATHPLVLLVAAVGAVPWFVYAWVTALHQRRGTAPYEDFTLGVQGWSALSVFALVMVLSSILNARRPPGWRAALSATGVASLLFGLAGIRADAVPGSLGEAWGAAAVLWGAALALAPWIASRGPTRDSRE